ncbi:hypothetical protein OROHE_021263 [Orobanche hederae]
MDETQSMFTDSLFTEAEYFCDATLLPQVVRQKTGCCAPTCFVDAITTRCNYRLKKRCKPPLELSAQSMIDCGGMYFSQTLKNHNLKPPTIHNCAKYAHHRGVYKTSVYPYTGEKERCKKPKGDRVKISSYKHVKGDVREIIRKRPLMGAIESTEELMRIRGD